MRTFFNFVRHCYFLFPFFGLSADARLDRLFEYDKQICTEILQTADEADLWNHFLTGQVGLYFSQEAKLLASEKCWLTAQNVLDLGSGNGMYLYRLSEAFKDKAYLGIEKQLSLVKQSDEEFGGIGLEFREGDVEAEIEGCKGQFDAILYRCTLLHLKNPKLSLEHAYQYLKQDGCVIIIDSFDPASRSSHRIPSVEDAFLRLNERNEREGTGNRRISIEILEELQQGKGPLAGLFQVIRTSLDAHGNRLEKGIRFESEQDRKRVFNHGLLLLAVLNKRHGIPVDFLKAYEELQVYLKDDHSWRSPGVHFLILKKI